MGKEEQRRDLHAHGGMDYIMEYRLCHWPLNACRWTRTSTTA
jgi:hypothetical protein